MRNPSLLRTVIPLFIGTGVTLVLLLIWSALFEINIPIGIGVLVVAVIDILVLLIGRQLYKD